MSALTFISHTEIGSAGVASITFDSNGAWASFTDLMLLGTARSASTNAGGWDLTMQVNGNSSNYAGARLYGVPPSTNASDTSATDKWSVGLGATSSVMAANTFGSFQVFFPNINSTTLNKAISTMAGISPNATGGVLVRFGGLWANTSAITSIKIDGAGHNIVQYSSFTLYGITKGSSGGVTVS